MNNIVYLLGAGASAQAMPLVSDFNKRMRLFSAFLSIAKESGLRNEFTSTLDEDFNKLIEVERSHYSIDTLAKKYWLAESITEYNRVKALMTCFFIYESFKKVDLTLPTLDEFEELYPKEFLKVDFTGSAKTIDLRYDALLAAIAKKNSSIELPQNIFFLSWNYDDQLEQAAWNITNAGKQFKPLVPSGLITSLSTPKSNLSDNSKINLIKLNGNFRPDYNVLDSKAENKVFKSFFDHRTLNPKKVNLIDKLYDLLIANPTTINIQFAWEHFTKSDKRIMVAKEIIDKATDLVVIGYSFPNYNVEVDQAIIGSKKGRFKNIYIEDNKENFEPLVERLQYLNIDVDRLNKLGNIKPYTDLKTFCLPPSFFVAYPKLATGVSRKSMI